MCKLRFEASKLPSPSKGVSTSATRKCYAKAEALGKKLHCSPPKDVDSFALSTPKLKVIVT